MKFLYVFDKNISEELKEKGLVQIGNTVINGKDADIFENKKDVYIGKYAKTEIAFMNKLMF